MRCWPSWRRRGSIPFCTSYAEVIFKGRSPHIHDRIRDEHQVDLHYLKGALFENLILNEFIANQCRRAYQLARSGTYSGLTGRWRVRHGLTPSSPYHIDAHGAYLQACAASSRLRRDS